MRPTESYEARFSRQQADALAVYGVEFESRMVPTSQGSAHVLVCGEGPRVFMIHGLGAPSALWAPLLAELRGFTVYAVDLPGHGLTPGEGRRLDRAAMRATAGRFLLDVIDALRVTRPTPIVANSLGSLWASWLALDYPDRVQALVHVGCPALLLGASAPWPMRLLSVGGVGPLLLEFRRPSRRQMYGLAAVLGDSLGAHARLADLLVTQDGAPRYKETLSTLSNALLRIRGARPELALGRQDLARIDKPVQLVWGEADPFGPPEIGFAAFASLARAELHVVRGGHAPWLTSAAHVGRRVENFLARVADSPDR